VSKHMDKEIRDIALFPEENPFPVMRVSDKGILLYANRTALQLLSSWQCVVGDMVPDFIDQRVKSSLKGQARLSLEISHSGRFFSLALVPILDRCYVNFYGQDVTETRLATEQLRQSESRYRELVENASSAIIRWQADGCITYFNEYAQTLFGYKPSEVLGRHITILLSDQEWAGQDLKSLVQDVVDHPDEFVTNINENICKDGKRIWMAWTNKRVYDDEGKVLELMSIGTDVTCQKMTEASVRENEMRFRQIADYMPQLVWTADPSGTVDYCNERRNEFDGFTQNPDGSWDWAPIVHPEEQAATIEGWKTAYQTGEPYEIKHRIKRSDGSFAWFLSRAFPIRNEMGGIVKWFGTATDIDAIKQAEIALEAAKRIAEDANQKLRELASTDVLTGLLNRRAFLEQAQDMFQLADRYQHPLSFLIIDIDHFKKVNDTFGHLGGDLVLIEFAKILVSCLRATDILGRIGGEEFAVILPETGPDHTAEMTERLLEKIRTTEIDMDGNRQISVTASIGVATIPPLAIDVGMVMRAADTALYKAKSEGRDRCCNASHYSSRCRMA